MPCRRIYSLYLGTGSSLRGFGIFIVFWAGWTWIKQSDKYFNEKRKWIFVFPRLDARMSKYPSMNSTVLTIWFTGIVVCPCEGRPLSHLPFSWPAFGAKITKAWTSTSITGQPWFRYWGTRLRENGRRIRTKPFPSMNSSKGPDFNTCFTIKMPLRVGTVNGTTTGLWEIFVVFQMASLTGAFTVGAKTGTSFIKEGTRKEKNMAPSLIGTKAWHA